MKIKSWLFDKMLIISVLIYCPSNPLFRAWIFWMSLAGENLRGRFASPRRGRISVAVFQVPCKGTKVFSRGRKPTDGTEGNKSGAPQGRHKAPIPVVLLPLHPYFSSSPPKPRGSPRRGRGYPQSLEPNLTLLLYRRYNNQCFTR